MRFHQYDLPDARRLHGWMVWPVTLFAGLYRIYAWQKSWYLVESGLVYRQLVLSALFTDRDGADATYQRGRNRRVQLLIPAVLRWVLPRAAFLSRLAGWSLAGATRSRKVMRAIEEGAI